MMEEWKTLTFGDVCSRITDGAHNSPPSVPEGKPMASVKDLTPFGIRLDSCRRVSDGDYERLVRQGCKPTIGDVLISKDGATALDTVCEFKCDVDVVLLSSVAILSPNPSIINSSYLRYYLDSSVTRSYLKASFISGAAIPRIVLKDLKRAAIRVPPMPIQIRIAGILSAYDELIENNQRRIRILEEMARSLYREWFVHFRYPGHEAIPLVDSPLGPIPKGWEVVALGGICERITDGAHKSPKSVESGVPMASVKDMHDFGFNLSTCRHISEEDYKALVRQDSVVRANDVLIAKDGSYLKHTFVAEKDMKVALLSSIAILRPSEKILSHLLAIGLRDDSVKGRMKQCVSGVAVPRIILKDFRRFQIVLPPEELQYKWNNLAGQSMQMCCSLIAQNRILKAQRDLLLPKLLSGQTRFD